MIKAALQEHYLLIVVSLIILLWGVGLQLFLNLNGESVFNFGFLFEFFFIFSIAPVLATVFSYVRGVDQGQSLKHIPDIVKEMVRPHNIIRYMICFVAIYIAITVFTSAKSLISVMIPFQYDVLFSDIDRWLHFGRYPHEYFGFILNNPKYLVFMDWFYISWFYYIYAYAAYVVFQPAHTPGRIQFVACFCLCWVVLGNFIATLASSVGPIFWEHYVDVPNPYETLMATLQNVSNTVAPLFCLDIAQTLLDWQNDDNLVDLSGPSSMPSVHVAMVVLFMFHSWNHNKFLFPITVFYCALTLIGSFVLAWHYAIDGYVSIILMYIMWKLVGLYRQ